MTYQTLVSGVHTPDMCVQNVTHVGCPPLTWCFSDRASWIDYVNYQLLCTDYYLFI